MNIKTLSAAFLALTTLTSATAFAAQDPSKSTNVKATLIENCKETVTGQVQGKLTTAEVAKFCSCNIDAQGRVTDAQRWEIISVQNQKKSADNLPFVQQGRKAFESCLGSALNTKVNSLNATQK